ncbi:MAG: SOS response-associated peptidase [Alphaproteobacteria bacterium]|nr:SOS response-associated peptidase [Alphaproteobacteria bacterium]
MCSRYEFRAAPADIIKRFGLVAPSRAFLDGITGPEIRPTDPALIIGVDQAPDILPWGLDVSWQKSPVINARAETAAEKPTFKTILNRRVLIPASAYYEWRHDGRNKIKTLIAPRDTMIFSMAGLRSDNCFVILTCSPAAPIAHIHSRMPVILDEASERAWLNPDYSYADLNALLHPFGGEFDTTETAPAPPRQSDLFG